MNENETVEIDVCYNDYFIEVYTIERRYLNTLIQTLGDDSQKSFEIGSKHFLKKDLNSVSIVNHGLGFIFMGVND